MKGRVVRAAGDTVLVRPEGAAPSGCGAQVPGSQAACNQAACNQAACAGGPALLGAKNPTGAELRPGQLVGLRREGLVSQSLGALLPPLAGFALGYALALRFAPGGGPEGAEALAGLAGMFLLALPVYFFRRRPGVSFTVKILN